MEGKNKFSNNSAIGVEPLGRYLGSVERDSFSCLGFI
jgi:hypothetical protein